MVWGGIATICPQRMTTERVRWPTQHPLVGTWCSGQTRWPTHSGTGARHTGCDRWRLHRGHRAIFILKGEAAVGAPGTAERPCLQTGPGQGQAAQNSSMAVLGRTPGHRARSLVGRPEPIKVTGQMERRRWKPQASRLFLFYFTHVTKCNEQGGHNTSQSSTSLSGCQHPDPLTASV